MYDTFSTRMVIEEHCVNWGDYFSLEYDSKELHFRDVNGFTLSENTKENFQQLKIFMPKFEAGTSERKSDPLLSLQTTETHCNPGEVTEKLLFLITIFVHVSLFNFTWDVGHTSRIGSNQLESSLTHWGCAKADPQLLFTPLDSRSVREVHRNAMQNKWVWICSTLMSQTRLDWPRFGSCISGHNPIYAFYLMRNCMSNAFYFCELKSKAVLCEIQGLWTFRLFV
jgi:hypothetical protein